MLNVLYRVCGSALDIFLGRLRPCQGGRELKTLTARVMAMNFSAELLCGAGRIEGQPRAMKDRKKFKVRKTLSRSRKVLTTFDALSGIHTESTIEQSNGILTPSPYHEKTF